MPERSERRHREGSSAPKSDAYRDYLQRAHENASRDFDSTVLTLSAGSLALSVTFLHDIAPTPRPGSIEWVLVAWLLFIVAAASVLVGYRLSQTVIEEALLAFEVEGRDGDRLVRLSRWANRLTALAGGSLVIGLSFFARFAVLNLAGG